MREPRRPPARNAFNEAADTLEGWRQQQIAALTSAQRDLYDQACRKSKEDEGEKARELEKRQRTDIQARMRKKLLAIPQPELVMGGKRVKLTEPLARRLAAEYFQPGSQQAPTQLHAAIRQAAKAAAREIQLEHARERRIYSEKEREKLDRLLRRFERARETKGQVRQEHSRAGVRGKAEADFAKRVREQLEQARKQRDRKRERGERGERGEDGRER